MPSISATLQLDADGLADLQAIPQQLEILVNTAKGKLDAIHGGAAAGDPFSGLLANFKALETQAADLPDLGSVLGPMQSLAKDLPDAGFVNISALTRDVDQMLEVFGPAKDSAAQRQPGCQPRARRGEGPRARAGSAQAGRRQQVGARPAGAFLRPVSLAAILGACAPGRAGARRLSRPAFRRRAGRPAGEALRRIAGRIGSSRPCPAARTRAHGVARRICGPRAILGRRQCASRGCEYRLVRAGGEPPRRAAVAHRAAGEARPRHLAIGGQSQQPRFPGARSAQGRHRGHRPSARVPYRQDHGRHPQPHRGACHEPGELGADTGGAASGRQRAHRLVPAISRAKPARRAAQPAAALPPPHDVGDRVHSRSRRSLAMSRRRCFRSRTRLASSTPTWSASPFTSSSTRSSSRSRRFRSPTSRPRSGRCGTRSNPFCSRSTRSSLA